MSTRKCPLEITLRPFDLTTDVDDLMVWVTDDTVSKFCSWDTYTSRTQAIKYITKNVLTHPYYRVICMKNRAIGAISVTLNTAEGDRCRGEIGYVLAARYWGCGIATRAVEMAVSDVFEERPELVRIEGLVDVQNKGSQRVLEKAGFLREGVLRKYCVMKGRVRDMVVFSFLSVDDRQKDSSKQTSTS